MRLNQIFYSSNAGTPPTLKLCKKTSLVRAGMWDKFPGYDFSSLKNSKWYPLTSIGYSNVSTTKTSCWWKNACETMLVYGRPHHLGLISFVALTSLITFPHLPFVPYIFETRLPGKPIYQVTGRRAPKFQFFGGNERKIRDYEITNSSSMWLWTLSNHTQILYPNTEWDWYIYLHFTIEIDHSCR